jgi:hypothetical protein
MKAPFKSIVIPLIDVDDFDITAEYIRDVFYCNNVATVSKVILIPFILNSGKRIKKAFVYIRKWHNTASAQNLINRLITKKVETRFIHNEDNWWVLEINTCDRKISENINLINQLKPFTTINCLPKNKIDKSISLDLSELIKCQDSENMLCC